jgi:hypothetical protein
MKVKIAGIGIMKGDENCSFCFEPKASIYVSIDSEIIPACNDCIGPAAIGEMAEVRELPRIKEKNNETL